MHKVHKFSCKIVSLVYFHSVQEAEIFDAGVDRTHLFTRTATIEGNSTSSCYKPVIEAILNTIEACTPYSNIYVISRSVSSDIKDISKVFEAAKSKHITINVLYFDKGCDNNEFEDLLPIVSNTGGVILQSFEVFEDFLQLISDTNFQVSQPLYYIIYIFCI